MDSSLNFKELQERCIKFLNDRNYICAATAYNNRVRSRVMDYVNRGLQIGFITWGNTIKIDHFKKNPHVSLCVDALQIEGTVKILGHPNLAEHPAVMELYWEGNCQLNLPPEKEPRSGWSRLYEPDETRRGYTL